MLPSYILLTALAAQFIYILVNWYFFKRKEYIFYAIYILAVTAYFLNKYLADDNGIVHLGTIEYFNLYADKILIIISFLFFFKFGRHFVEAATRYPRMNSFLRKTEWFSLVYIIADALLLFFTRNFQLENLIFSVANISFTVIALTYVLRIMIRRMQTLDRFIFMGTMLYGSGAFITLWLGQNKPLLADDHFLALQIGAILEMICLNAGLVYKSKMLHNEAIILQKQLLERYEENQDLFVRLGDIRERIRRNLHDDVGATLSSVKAYSEILKDNPNNPLIAELIKNNSTEMLERLEVISWATNPQHDNFKSLQDTMLKFARPFCNSQNIDLNFEKDGIDDQLMMPGDVRQNIFLVFKESINNMMKYADAKECRVNMFIKNQKFILYVKDNGKGCDGIIHGSGSGLKNMNKRAEELNGKTEIITTPGEGTIVRLSIPYPFRIPNSWDKKSNDL